MKRRNSIIIVVVFTLVVAVFFIMKNLNISKDGRINPYFAANLQLDKILNSGVVNSKSIEENREKLNRESMRFSKEPIPFHNVKDITIEENSSKVPVRIYTPEESGELPIIIYSHGGSWIAGNLDTHDNVCRKLSNNTKAIVISVDYHLAPENPFPIGVNDVYSILQWTSKNGKSINGNESMIAVVGDSAGGNLSAVASLMARDKNGPSIKCEVLIYPSTNIYELNTESWSDFSNNFNISADEMEQYISFYIPKKEDRKSPYASPLLAANFKDLPNTFIITAEIDPLRDEGEAYGNKLKEAGNEVKVTRISDVSHGFITMDKITNKADEVLNEISTYLQSEFRK